MGVGSVEGWSELGSWVGRDWAGQGGHDTLLVMTRVRVSVSLNERGVSRLVS